MHDTQLLMVSPPMYDYHHHYCRALLQMAEAALADEWVINGDRVALQRRVLRLGKPPRRWKRPCWAAVALREPLEVVRTCHAQSTIVCLLQVDSVEPGIVSLDSLTHLMPLDSHDEWVYHLYHLYVIVSDCHVTVYSNCIHGDTNYCIA